jgi:hypothetical protein
MRLLVSDGDPSMHTVQGTITEGIVMGVAALVLGIIGTLLSLIPILGMYAIPLTAIALVLGVLGARKPKKGLAIAGLVLGLIGTGIGGWQYSLSKKVSRELADPNSEINKAVDRAAADLANDAKNGKH